MPYPLPMPWAASQTEGFEMPMPGQADSAPETSTIGDVAAFLDENPGADADESEEESHGEPADADTPDDAGAAGEDDPAGDDEPDADDADGDDAADPATQTGQKFKVTVKGEDGADQTVEVDQKELVAGYQRHADYTRKTQELSSQRAQVLQIAEQKIHEGREVYLTEAHKARQLVVRLAELSTPEEMAQLARQDPQAAFAERARQDAVLAVLDEIDQGISRERQQLTQAQEARLIEQRDEALRVLDAKGVKREEITPLFERIHSVYGVPKERFKNLTDPALVLIMRDAMKFRNAETAATKRAPAKAKAPPPVVPAPRANTPRETKASKTLERKFSSGRAGVKDLAAWIGSNSR